VFVIRILIPAIQSKLTETIMGNIAVAHGPANLGEAVVARLKAPHKHKRRQPVANTAQWPWSGVALLGEAAVSNRSSKVGRPPAHVWLLAAAAILLHASIGWYVISHAHAPNAKPKPAEVALQFERPKPPPKIEPPKQEPKREQPKQAQILPPIETAAPEPSAAPAVASAEPPVFVPPVAAAPAPPAPVTAPIGRAGYLNNPPPEYPAAALRQGWQGTVVLHVHVLANGKPDIVDVQKSSGRKALDDEAVRTVKNFWSYTPAKRGDTPIDGWTTTPIEFQIDG
jgi:protein TonB